MKMSKGLRAKMRKSSVVSVRPIVSMMIPKITVCVVPRTQLKTGGKKNVNSAIPITKTVACLASHPENDNKAFTIASEL